MASLDIDTALRIWRSDDGYKSINSYLAETDYLYHRRGTDVILFDGVEYSTPDVIDVLVQNMESEKEEMTYYRGGSEKSQRDFVKNNFISVTDDEELASTFVQGDCCIYKITVAPEVKRIKTRGVEDETLLEPGLFWKYQGKNKDIRFESTKYHIANVSRIPTNAPAEEKSTSKLSKRKLSQQDLRERLAEYVEEWGEFDCPGFRQELELELNGKNVDFDESDIMEVCRDYNGEAGVVRTKTRRRKGKRKTKGKRRRRRKRKTRRSK